MKKLDKLRYLLYTVKKLSGCFSSRSQYRFLSLLLNLQRFFRRANVLDELQFFIKSHPDELSYDETLAKHLLSKITIFDDHIVFEFKSGVTVSVEK